VPIGCSGEAPEPDRIPSARAKAVATLLVCLALLNGTLWAESPRLCSVRGHVVNVVGEQPLKNA